MLCTLTSLLIPPPFPLRFQIAVIGPTYMQLEHVSICLRLFFCIITLIQTSPNRPICCGNADSDHSNIPSRRLHTFLPFCSDSAPEYRFFNFDKSHKLCTDKICQQCDKYVHYVYKRLVHELPAGWLLVTLRFDLQTHHQVMIKGFCATGTVKYFAID